MHIVMLSLTVAFVVCVVLLVAFGLFTTTELARRIYPEDGERRHTLRPS